MTDAEKLAKIAGMARCKSDAKRLACPMGLDPMAVVAALFPGRIPLNWTVPQFAPPETVRVTAATFTEADDGSEAREALHPGHGS